ncbi:hypothetical protein ALI22I_01850 [Saccharothrix sp. ALI-22-I]|uniref:DUF6461 domain-containing protein n=1 Tax=Saccharothrix sp. ALI-22-I TaxID=1933778 RepID=UPI00097BC778|nr:DUF6461 domain-containing protein [Saccharothrix sp. ALI-22-I]ONI92795.1 hypothetical protein ALI22I_01850 [Saccharothrix sp. ALI-22-I]
MHQLTDAYDWIERQDVVMTFAVITRSTTQAVVRTYGGDPASSRPMTTVEAEDAALDDRGHFHVQVFEHQDHVIALENNGWSGTIPEIARRASAGGGSFFSVHWNVNGLFRITEAADGKVTACFDPMRADADDPGEVVPGWAAEVTFEVGKLRATCLAVAEQQTGVAFDQAWLAAKLTTYRIPDPDVLLKDVEDARVP